MKKIVDNSSAELIAEAAIHKAANRNDLSSPFEKISPFNVYDVMSRGKIELDFVYSGVLAKSIGLLVGQGGSGKSYFMMQAAVAIATGDFAPTECTFGWEPNKIGRSVYLNLEDPPEVVHNRLNDLYSRFGKNEQAIELINQNFQMWPLSGNGFYLLDEKTGRNHRVIDEIKERLGGNNPARFCCLDTISRSFRGDENSNSLAAEFIEILTEVAVDSGCAIVAVHHVSKAAVGANARDDKTADSASASRGASALTSNARWVGYLSNMNDAQCKSLIDPDSGVYGEVIGERHRKKYAQFSVAKSNYKEVEDSYWLKRTEGGILIRKDLKEAILPSKPSNAKRTDSGNRYQDLDS